MEHDVVGQGQQSTEQAHVLEFSIVAALFHGSFVAIDLRGIRDRSVVSATFHALAAARIDDISPELYASIADWILRSN